MPSLRLPKISKCLNARGLSFLHNSRRCSFPGHSSQLCSRFCVRMPGARDPGAAPPDRCASGVRSNTPETDPLGSPVVDRSLPPPAQLALSAGHRQAGNGRILASRWLPSVLDLAGAPQKSGRPLLSGEVRDLIRKMCRENPSWGAPRIHGELLKLGIHVAESSVSKYMLRCHKPPSQT